MPGHDNRSRFQSPSRWGRCCIAPDRIAADPALRFSPLLDGDGVASGYQYRPGIRLPIRFSPLLDGDGVASISGTCTLTINLMAFQSPSRWGRCCIAFAPAAAPCSHDVSVPFSMGTVLHRPRAGLGRVAYGLVSVPFSMGTVLHLRSPTTSAWVRSSFQSPSRWGRCCIAATPVELGAVIAFQSPSRWGRCCIAHGPARMGSAASIVSVPFSMGTVLHHVQFVRGDACQVAFQSPSRWGRCCISARRRAVDTALYPFQSPSRWGRCCIHGAAADTATIYFMFQSPSRWGRCCIASTADHLSGRRQVSVPFSMGTVLHLLTVPDCREHDDTFQSPSRWGRCCIDMSAWSTAAIYLRFSPLLDGDGVASRLHGTTLYVRSACFSPLLDGDGVASSRRRSRPPTVSWVSVPFSMGTVLHRSLRHRDVGRCLRFQSPSRWGRCCIAVNLSAVPSVLSRFSPLLDGDGVASCTRRCSAAAHRFGFSPLLDGDGVASRDIELRMPPTSAVSVPFSMGTVLHPQLVGDASCRCSIRFSPLLDGDGVASMRTSRQSTSRCIGFSPLLDGDGVASHDGRSQRAAV